MYLRVRACNAKLVLRKKPTVLQSRYWFAAVGLNPLPYFNGTKNSKMHSKPVLENNLSFITPRCLRQGPQCMLLSCFNAIYNFYSFILPSEMIEQIPVIVIAFVYLKYSQRRLSSKSKSAMQTTPCLELGQTPMKGGLYILFRTKRYVKNHTFLWMPFLGQNRR